MSYQPFQMPADGWFEIAKPSRMEMTIPGPDGEPIKVIEVIDRDDINKCFANFQATARQPGWSGMLVDFDHFSLDDDKSTEAAGWVLDPNDLRISNAGSLMAKPRLSDSGEAAITGGRFRGVSPVFLVEMRAGTGPIPEIHPVVIENFSLTNRPRIKGMKPISNRDTENATGSETQTQTPPVTPATTEKPKMQKIAEMLGLPPEATEDQCLAEIGKLKETAAAVAPMQTEVENMKNQVACRDLEKYKDRIGGQEDFWKTQLVANRESAIKALDALPASSGLPAGRVLNREISLPASPVNTAGKPEAAEKLVREIRVRNRCSYSEAWNIAAQEKPELFQS